MARPSVSNQYLVGTPRFSKCLHLNRTSRLTVSTSSLTRLFDVPNLALAGAEIGSFLFAVFTANVRPSAAFTNEPERRSADDALSRNLIRFSVTVSLVRILGLVLLSAFFRTLCAKSASNMDVLELVSAINARFGQKFTQSHPPLP